MSRLLIIGGSRGIGEAILQQNIEKRPCINISRTAPGIEHPELESFQLDILSDPLPELGEISGLVYCPGSINLKPLSSLKDEDFIEDFRINVLGAARVVRQYYRSMKEVPGSSIVMFSTVAVGQGMPFHSSIAAAKAGVEGLARSLAAEMAPHIRVNCIAPSITDTELAASILRSEKAREKIAGNHPLQRLNSAGEVASLASFLLSDQAAGITGQVLAVDGGLSRIKI